MVIEKDKIYTENGNRTHGFGNLDLATFEPYPKNPPISKVFREIGLADELGSGMRNTYKYTRLYSRAEPQFVEGDVFRTIIPLTEAAAAVAGPVQFVRDAYQDTPQVDFLVTINRQQILIEYCAKPRSKKEMMLYMGLTDAKHFRKTYLKPLLAKGKIGMTIPNKPNSRNQKYVKL